MGYRDARCGWADGQAGTQLRDFEALPRYFAEDILHKWIDYFILHRQIPPVTVTRRLR